MFDFGIDPSQNRPVRLCIGERNRLDRREIQTIFKKFEMSPDDALNIEARLEFRVYAVFFYSHDFLTA